MKAKNVVVTREFIVVFLNIGMFMIQLKKSASFRDDENVFRDRFVDLRSKSQSIFSLCCFTNNKSFPLLKSHFPLLTGISMLC